MIKSFFFRRPLRSLLIIFLISVILFYPSFFVFFTNDDFYLLNISNATSLKEFFLFFNPFEQYKGLGMYRPLTTQVFYFLGRSLFNLNPFYLHIISFIVFFSIIYLVYKLILLLAKNEKVALISAFLYATSASHFAHLYYLATFQELGMTLFFILSLIFFIRYLSKNNRKLYFLSVVFFVFSLMSKETAVVLPFVLLLTAFLINNRSKIKETVPYFLILLIYLSLRVFYYGFAQGESYIWDFSLRIFNTVFWYGLWSLNLPELLVDYVGPGFQLNPNLIAFWGNEMKPIIGFFSVFVFSILFSVVKDTKRVWKKWNKLIVFGVLWFIFTLVPVLLLPLHKFTFYLTLPLIGFVLVISIYLSRQKNILLVPILLVWLLLSFFTLDITRKSHWITRGSLVSKRVHEYMVDKYASTQEKVYVRFVDYPEDDVLPWEPSEVVEVAISKNNFFELYFKDKVVLVGGETEDLEVTNIKARDFIGY